MYTVRFQLPSRGKLGFSHIQVRPPKVEDVRNYLVYTGSNKTAINSLLSSLCKEEIGGISTGDRNYLFVNIRAMINPDPMSGSYQCPLCKAKNQYTVEVSDLRVKQISEEYEHPMEFKLLNKDTIKMSLFTVDMETKQKEYLELHKTSDDKIQNSELGEDLPYFSKLALMMVNKKSIDENIKYILGLDMADFEILVMFETAFDIGIDMSFVHKCTTCEEKSKIVIPLDDKFLGVSIAMLSLKHRFLNKVSGIGFRDFLEYTYREMEDISTKELELKRSNKS